MRKPSALPTSRDHESGSIANDRKKKIHSQLGQWRGA
jgi:hypothetical protein